MVDLSDPPQIGHANGHQVSRIERKPVANESERRLSPVSPMTPAEQGKYEAVSAEENMESHDDFNMVTDWPTSQKLRKKTAMSYLFLIWDAFLTLLPTVFLVFGACARSLDRQPLSRFGDHIMKGSTFGPTVFPIVFAATVTRLMRGIALRRAERGSRLGLLEQLIGSQSLAGTVERWIVLRRFNLVGGLIVALWLLSPVGGQSSLRILSIVSSGVVGQGNVAYFNTSSILANSDGLTGPTSFDGPLAEGANVVSSLLGAGLLASAQVLQSPTDQWGNVKIPRLDEMSPLSDELPGNPWIEINDTNNKVWSSLSGVMMTGPPSTGTSNFTIEASYMDFNCSNSTRLYDSAYNNPNNTAKITYTNAFEQIGVKSLLVGNTSIPFTASNSLFVSTDDQRDWENHPDPAHLLYLFYGSKLASEGDYFDMYNCSLTYPKVSANISCTGLSCGVTHLRRSTTDLRSPAIPPFSFDQLENLLTFLPSCLGLPQDGIPAPLDQYMLGSTTPLSAGETPILPDFLGTPGPVFAKRFTTILNTVWQASVSPFSISLGSSANFSSDPAATFTASDFNSQYVPTGHTSMTTVHQEQIYAANHTYIGLLLVISLILQGCAIAGFVLNRIVTAPDILGYVSTMTRDNPYTDVPLGGTALDGLERARLLAGMKVQLADVSIGKAEGHIALRSVEPGHYNKSGDLSRKRIYY